MDYTPVITRNRALLVQIVAALAAMAGVGGAARMLPRSIYRALMLVLLPAESAARRLVLIAAYGLSLKQCPPRGAPAGLSGAGGDGRKPVFALFDPRKTFDMQSFYSGNPSGFESGYHLGFQPLCACPQDDSPVHSRLIALRIEALMRALEALPRQARRLARWRVRRDAALKANRPLRPRLLSPIRPGLPPGWRQRHRHEIDAVLADLHYFAGEILNRRDSP